MEDNKKILVETSRFVYSDEFTKEIEYFSKLHRYDDRKTFKEMWLKWIEEETIRPLIEKEIETSVKNGYKGNIMDKMYKSARYYYRKKEKQFLKKIEKENEQREITSDENNYAGLSKEMIKQMDSHIMKTIYNSVEKMEKSKNKTNNVFVSKVKPAIAFEQFCQKFINEITREIYKLKKKIELNPTEISLKFKKSYKNRFYKIRMELENK